ncbi:S41 family peptidase [uncultured Umboniibacter sp.]|uniref:S41 family peptidase n=1 Tax=uncultured Umboniibacter sp. TaxID=1798917 RepID=UPI0026210E29|nr:S41 family peptidase [uncultured Umboniibacter sp.]
MSSYRFRKSLVIAFLTSFALVGCGGSGSDSGSDAPPSSGGGATGPSYTPGVFDDPDNFVARCENPRTFNDINGNPYNDQAGSILYENHFLRSWSNDTYLWYNELPDLDPGDYNDPLEYFELLRTDATTPSGNPKDRFHFTYETSEYEQLTQAGISVSYGIEWALVKSTPPRELYIRYIEPGSPADASVVSLTRGVKVLAIDGVDVENGNDVDTLNAGLFPSSIGESHTFTIQDLGSAETRDVTLEAVEVEADPVPIVDVFNTASGNVGYVFFNDHNFVSEDKLVDAMTSLSNNNVTDLVLDLRYNGGGLLYIASQLSYMIAGPTATNGRIFDELRFNDKYPSTNPITGETLSPTPFYSTTSQYSDKYGGGVQLPVLNLNRVFILTTGGTCSASEAIINGLRGIDVEVVLVGSTTCGKPYGFYPTDNCGTTYFTIQFDGANDKGQGEYSDGFTPMNEPIAPGILQNGCYVEDDLSSALGDVNDPMIAAALNYRIDSSCPVLTAVSKGREPAVRAFKVNSSGFQPFDNGGFGSKQNMIRLMTNYTDPFKQGQ